MSFPMYILYMHLVMFKCTYKDEWPVLMVNLFRSDLGTHEKLAW